ncbi:hypothetical protein [Desertihabitans aurantiacus]|uniref:hypothetical protein n=1 Tax=Desertihabitans aurantiacus TaxID=2282477 RepID=UPI000DF7FAC3|nr:hypothetical protein [Desertihabitans aurantiacus]
MTEPRTHENTPQPDGTGRAPASGEQHSEELREAERAQLLPEEDVVGSDDPQAQAAEILHDSDARTDDPEGTLEESVQSPEHGHD